MLSYGVLYTTLQSFARYQYWLPTDRPQCRTHGVCPWDACRMPRQTTQWLSARLCTSDAQGAPTFDLNSTNGTLLQPAVFRGVEKNKKKLWHTCVLPTSPLLSQNAAKCFLQPWHPQHAEKICINIFSLRAHRFAIIHFIDLAAFLEINVTERG